MTQGQALLRVGHVGLALRRLRLLIFLAGLLLASFAGARQGLAPASAFTPLPAGFEQTIVAGGLNLPMDFAFAPDGRIFVVEKAGVVRVIEDGILLPTPVLDIQQEVNSFGDRGLYSVALDPEFGSNGYFYLLYTYDPVPDDFIYRKTSHLSRFTLTGSIASTASEVVILGAEGEVPCDQLPVGANCIPADLWYHVADQLRFADDGTLLVSIGDSSDTSAGYDSLRAQDLDWLVGKILRIHTDGSGVEGNPFWNGDADANRSKVFVRGLRNPFRYTLRPGTQDLWVGDVGEWTWEEINVFAAGANGGWPCYEGTDHMPTFEFQPACQALYLLGPAAVADPVHVYGRDNGACVVAGDFPASYPEPYNQGFFFGDCVFGTIGYLALDEDNDVARVETFATDVGIPVSFKTGPDGEIYYLELLSGDLRHIHYTGGNRHPEAVAGAEPSNGLAPLDVQFAGDGSADPDGDALAYEWDFGDESPLSSEPNPEHQYPADGVYYATLTVDDGHGGQASDSVVITVGDEAPEASIDAPLDGSTYLAGRLLAFSGSAFDPQDGPLSGESLSWHVILHHNAHVHPFFDDTGDDSGFIIPDHGDNSWFEIVLTATDSAGLEDTARVFVYPQTVQLTIDTVPSGLSVAYDGRLLEAPLVLTAPANSLRNIGVAPLQILGTSVVAFTGWSDGGAAHHTIASGVSDQSLVAAFSASGPQEDFDGDGLSNENEIKRGTSPVEIDTDGDGCTDGTEAAWPANAAGPRNPRNSWDFFDTPDSANVRDRMVSLGDILSVAFRVGSGDQGGSAEMNRWTDPNSPPRASPFAYHPAFDRSPPPPGGNPAELGPPDGSIGMYDIMAVIFRYGVHC